MNKNISVVLLGVFIIGLFSLTVAVAPNPNEGTNVIGKQARTDTQGNMTFGQCVSEKAIVKNTCYQTVKVTRDSCKTDARNQTEPRPALKNCRDTFKKDLKQCKMDFKQAKNECKKIKHNFFEGAGAAFK